MQKKKNMYMQTGPKKQKFKNRIYFYLYFSNIKRNKHSSIE